MPLIFWGIDATQRLSSTLQMVMGMSGVLLAVGVVVGAIHGFALTSVAIKEKAAGFRHDEA